LYLFSDKKYLKANSVNLSEETHMKYLTSFNVVAISFRYFTIITIKQEGDHFQPEAVFLVVCNPSVNEQ
jgi:hypothetical protein